MHRHAHTHSHMHKHTLTHTHSTPCTHLRSPTWPPLTSQLIHIASAATEWGRSIHITVWGWRRQAFFPRGGVVALVWCGVVWCGVVALVVWCGVVALGGALSVQDPALQQHLQYNKHMLISSCTSGYAPPHTMGGSCALHVPALQHLKLKRSVRSRHTRLQQPTWTS